MVAERTEQNFEENRGERLYALYTEQTKGASRLQSVHCNDNIKCIQQLCVSRRKVDILNINLASSLDRCL